MPTYQYECDGCGHAFEMLQSMTDKKLKKCPKCSKLKLHRLIGSGAGVIFKGSGFYETDYKRKSGTDTSSQSSKDNAKSSSDPCSGSCSCAPKAKKPKASNGS